MSLALLDTIPTMSSKFIKIRIFQSTHSPISTLSLLGLLTTGGGLSLHVNNSEAEVPVYQLSEIWITLLSESTVGNEE